MPYTCISVNKYNAPSDTCPVICVCRRGHWDSVIAAIACIIGMHTFRSKPSSSLCLLFMLKNHYAQHQKSATSCWEWLIWIMEGCIACCGLLWRLTARYGCNGEGFEKEQWRHRRNALLRFQYWCQIQRVSQQLGWWCGRGLAGQSTTGSNWHSQGWHPPLARTALCVGGKLWLSVGTISLSLTAYLLGESLKPLIFPISSAYHHFDFWTKP